jgi:enoyl-CoA hydratase
MRDGDIPSDFTELAEPPVTPEYLRTQAAAFPHAWEIARALLRSIDLEDMSAGLVQESLAYGALQGGPEHASWLSERSRKATEAGYVQVSREGDVIDILLDRPDARNAIDRTMRDALQEAFTMAALDPEVTRVRLRGVGKAFCVGADLDEFGTTRDPALAHAIRMQTLPALAIIGCADKFEAHVQGACVGAGLEMAAFAHRLTATPDAWFQLPELAMGLIPGAGGSVSVTRRIGRPRAALMILSGKRINAQVALGWGLIDAIVNDAAAGDGHSDVAG